MIGNNRTFQLNDTNTVVRCASQRSFILLVWVLQRSGLATPMRLHEQALRVRGEGRGGGGAPAAATVWKRASGEWQAGTPGAADAICRRGPRAPRTAAAAVCSASAATLRSCRPATTPLRPPLTEHVAGMDERQKATPLTRCQIQINCTYSHEIRLEATIENNRLMHSY